MGERPRLELFAGLASLYQSRDYADLLLFGQDGGNTRLGLRHPVHKAIVCPRSEFIQRAVREGRWRDGIEGQITLPDDDEIVRLVVEYLYLLDYDPLVRPRSSSAELPTPTPSTSSSHAGFSTANTNSSSSGNDNNSDTMSIRTDAGQYGHVYGASAVSAFGGPVHHHQHHMDSTLFHRPRNESTLTVHALPTSTTADFANFPGTGPIRRHHHKPTLRGPGGSLLTSAPDPSPLASPTPHLVLHAHMYAAGTRYSIPGLKALALDKFKIQMTRHWDSEELAEAIHVVYSGTPASDKEMREAVADTLGWHGTRLLEKPEIEVAIMEINGLAYELLKRSRRVEPEFE